MKYLAIVFTCFSFAVVAQKGAVSFSFVENPTLEPIQTCVYLQKDSTEEFLGCSDENGRLFLGNLAAGANEFRLESYGDSLGTYYLYVQNNQLFSSTVLVDTLFNSIGINRNALYQVGPNGDRIKQQPVAMGSVQTLDSRSIPAASIQSLACVQVVSYKTPLIDKSGGASGYTITREDVSRMPTRSAVSISSTVGGVQATEGTDQLHIRGARSDANTYYLDGMRVQSLDGIPRSYMGEVTVYTGGIPANYGDVTGGIVAVESKPIGRSTYSRYNYRAPSRRHRLNRSEPTSTQTPTASVEPAPTYEPRISADRFEPIYENMFLSPIENRHSTFGLDVDRASWTYVQQRFAVGAEVRRDAVKMEEMINAFKYEELAVADGEDVALKVSRADCMWNENSELVTVQLKAKKLPEGGLRDPHNFVFLIDVSGSMNSYNKLGLLKEGLSTFVKTLQPNDKVAIVTYAGNVGVVLNSTSNKDSILGALDNLQSGGSTNGFGGIQLAYQQAEANYDSTYNNRIILCTDGDFNIGISSTTELEAFISQKRGKGIYLTALGYGMGNYRNDILETLADRGDGNHFYINSLQESKKVLCDEVGNLVNLARDAKLDVEFDGHMVSAYRLIGYENRMLLPEDFVDDTKDGGEIGYGHEVMAVYEVERCSDASTTESDVLATVKLRYKLLEAESSNEFVYELKGDAEKADAVKLNTVIAFGLLLRDSAFKGDITPEGLRQFAQTMKVENEDDQKLLEMIGTFTMAEL